MTIPPVRLGAYTADFEGFSADLGASFERYGFAVIADCDIPADLIARAVAAAKAFFALPEAAKRAYIVPGGAGQRGYTAFGVETAKGADHHDLKEFWHVGRDLPPGHPYQTWFGDNLWPSEVAGFREDLTALYVALEALSLRLLRAIAHHLRLDDDYFTPTVRDGDSILRLLHYPPVAEGAGGVRPGRMRTSTPSPCCWAPRRPGWRCWTATASGWRSIRRRARWWSISATCCSA